MARAVGGAHRLMPRAMDATDAAALMTRALETRDAIRRGEGADAIARFEPAYADARDAMDWLLEHERVDDALAFAGALVPFWMATGRVEEGQAWLGRALELRSVGDGPRARALHDLGYLAFFAGDAAVAGPRFAEARDVANRAGDHDAEALALAGSARVALTDDPAAAARLCREALALTADLPESRGRSSAEHVLGVALQLAGDLEGAREVMTTRLERARRDGLRFVVFSESANLSMVERQLGNLARARELSLEALDIVVGNDDEMATAWVLNGIAAVEAAMGRMERAATLLFAAESLLAAAHGEWPADEQAQFDATLGIVSAALSAEGLEAARVAGGAMRRDEAVAMAIQDP
jgi:tetratricopeptide (TPR) repeat protein